MPPEATRYISSIEHPRRLLVLGAGPVDSGATGPVVVTPGTLPADWQDTSDAASLAARYRAAYGRLPDRAAAEAYGAARRIDLAVRAQGGTSDRVALVRSLQAAAAGIEWQGRFEHRRPGPLPGFGERRGRKRLADGRRASTIGTQARTRPPTCWKW